MRRLLLSLVLLAVPAAASAQELQALAAVPVASPTGGGVRNLSFGSVTPVTGQTTVVSVPAQSAPPSGTVYSGEFRFSVAGNAGLQFSLSLPTQLTSTIGGLTLPVSFNGNTYGARCIQGTAGTCTTTNFNPTTGPFRVCRVDFLGLFCWPTVWPAGSQLRVFLGGQLSVPANQVAAVYTGTVTLTILQVY